MALLKQSTALFPIKECFVGKVPLISLGRVSGAPLATTSVTAWSCCVTSVGEQGTELGAEPGSGGLWQSGTRLAPNLLCWCQRWIPDS